MDIRVVVSAALIFVSLLILLLGSNISAIVELKEADLTIPSSLNASVPNFMENRFWSQFCVSLTLSIWIAVFILLTIDWTKSNQTERMLDRKIRSMSESVFQGALSVNFPASIVAEAIKTVFSDRLYRDRFSAKYVLEKAKSGNGFALKIHIEYDLVNDTDSTEKFTPELSFYGLKHLDYRKTTRVESIVFKSNPEAAFKSACSPKAIEKVNAAIASSDDHRQSISGRLLSIPAKGRITVQTTYILWKELSDNEVFRGGLSTLGMSVKLSNLTGMELDFGISPIHREQMTTEGFEEDTTVEEWKLASPTLPHNGYVLYWRPKLES